MSNKRFPGLVSGPVQERDRSRNPLWKIRRFVFGGFLLGLLGVIALLAYNFNFVDLPDDISESLQEENVICASDVTENCTVDNAMAAGATVDEDRELIEPEDFDEVPQIFIDALLSAEDKTFYTHSGVEASSLVRAAGRSAMALAGRGGVVQGGSTITQQYVKKAYIDEKNTSTWKRKTMDPVLALKLEQRLADEIPECSSGDKKRCVKNEILRRYLNTVYFGRNGSNLAYGLKVASKTYFGKENMQELTLEEAAYLVVTLRAPESASLGTDGSFIGDPKQLRFRIDATLGLMLKEGYITEADIAKAQADMDANASPDKYDGVGLPTFVEARTTDTKTKGSDFGSRYFVDATNQELAELAESGDVRQGGLKVYTTLDLAKQEQAHKTVTNYVKADNPQMPNAALVSVDSNGLVRAMVGGTNYQERQFNYARDGYTQVGSLNKTFGLAVALEQGLSMNSLLVAPSEMVFPKANGGEDWVVGGGISDFPDEQQPKYGNLREATERSWNTAYAQLIQLEQVGPPRVAAKIEEFGIRAVPESQQVPSLILGVNGATPMEMASAYSTFEREGVKVDPVIIEKIENSRGEVICWYPSNGKCESKSAERPQRKATQIIDAEIARQINGALVDVVKSGTGKNANQIPHAAGKTGTTQDYQAAWFAGFSCDLTTTVMMGYEGELRMSDAVNQAKGNDVLPMRELFGDNASSKGNITSGLPAKMWGDYMKAIDKPACNGINVSTNYTGNVLGQELVTNLDVCGAVPVPQPQPDPNQPGNPNQQLPVDPTQPGNGQQQPGQPQQKLEDLVLPDGRVISADQLRFLSEEQIEQLKNGGQLRNGLRNGQVQNVSFSGSLAFQEQVAQQPAQPCLVYEGNGRWVSSNSAANPAGPATSMPETTVPETTMPETTMSETTLPETTQKVPTTRDQPPTTLQSSTTEEGVEPTVDESSTTKKEEEPGRPTSPRKPNGN